MSGTPYRRLARSGVARLPARVFLALLLPAAIFVTAATAPDAMAGKAKCSSGSGLLSRVPPTVRKIVQELAPKYGLDPLLVYAVIAAESAFRTRAVSHANAQGLMQLIPGTAKRFGVKDPFDPKQNVRGGMKYLRWLLKKFEGNINHALAGYNAGEGAVMRYRGIPPYRETKAYVKKIRRMYNCGGGGNAPGKDSIRLASVFFDELGHLGESLDAVALENVRSDGELDDHAATSGVGLQGYSNDFSPVLSLD